jgi:hypothetical protein
MDDITSQNTKDSLKDLDSKLPQIEFSLDSLNLSKSSVINILEDLRVIKKRFNHIENILKESERSQHRPSVDLPGITGKFDGEFMVTADGAKMSVPKNYAAKSLLVFGDELKRMEQDGKEAYKILSKVDRKKIEGLLSKKDGRYVILSDSGTFNLSKNAVEFRNIKQGEWVSAVIPEKGPHGDFAAIDKIIKKDKNKEIKFFEVKKEDKKIQPQPRPMAIKPAEPKPMETKPIEPKVEMVKKDTPTISSPASSDDDLV